MATDVRAARLSSSGEQSACTSNSFWKCATRSAISASRDVSRSAASSSTSSISTWPPKYAHCCVRSE